MTTLKVGKRRCDATCQGSEGRICRCICFGANHGRSWRNRHDDECEPVIVKPRRLPRHERQQLHLFEGVPAY